MKITHLQYRFFQCSLMIVCFLLFTSTAWGQERRRFNPEKFDAELTQFVVQEASLTQAETARFLPIYTEMLQKKRLLFRKMKRFRKIDTSDNAACAKAIKEQDEADLEMKRQQKHYHSRLLSILPAGKLMRVIQAEEKFHRRAFQRAVKNRQ